MHSLVCHDECRIGRVNQIAYHKKGAVKDLRMPNLFKDIGFSKYFDPQYIRLVMV